MCLKASLPLWMASVLDGIRSYDCLSNTLAFSHVLMEPAAYAGMGGGTSLTTSPFRCNEGIRQGAVKSGWSFTLACNPAFQCLNETLAANGGAVMAIIDDN